MGRFSVEWHFGKSVKASENNGQNSICFLPSNNGHAFVSWENGIPLNELLGTFSN